MICMMIAMATMMNLRCIPFLRVVAWNDALVVCIVHGGTGKISVISRLLTTTPEYCHVLLCSSDYDNNNNNNNNNNKNPDQRAFCCDYWQIMTNSFFVTASRSYSMYCQYTTFLTSTSKLATASTTGVNAIIIKYKCMSSARRIDLLSAVTCASY